MKDMSIDDDGGDIHLPISFILRDGRAKSVV